MIPRSIVNQLNKQLPYLINSYGGIDLFLSYLREYFKISSTDSKQTVDAKVYQSIINHLYNLLKFKEDLIVVNPWSLAKDFKVFAEDNSTRVAANSINVDIPYTVYTSNGSLLYTVKNHGGIFGNSKLDKYIIAKSFNTETYYLKYVTYQGDSKIKLLIINLHTRQILLANELYKVVSTLEQSNITIANFSFDSVSVYTLEDIPKKSFDLNTIINLGTIYTLTNNTLVDIIPTIGSWLLIKAAVNSSLSRTKITNFNNDLIIPILDSNIPESFTLYYVGVNMDVGLLNKTFNLNLTWSDKKLDEVIEIN